MPKLQLGRYLLVALLLATFSRRAQSRGFIPGERLDFQAHFHIDSHARGKAVAAWLSDHTKVVPALARPSEHWPGFLVIGYASGYNFQVLKPLIYSFLANADKSAWLVLLVKSDEDLQIPEQCSDRVVVQKHGWPEALEDFEDVPYPVSLRFYVTLSLLDQLNHNGTVFFVDTRDVFIQTDPFQPFADGIMHFPQESTAYRIKGPYTSNHQWLLLCFGQETSDAIGGHYVLNSGTLIGPSQMMRAYFGMMVQELEHRWHCRRLHGSDQAIHNYLVYTGKLVRSGIKFQVEDQISSRFAFIAYSHPRVYDFRYISDTQEEMYNIGNDLPMVAIHLWPGDNRAANMVVWPMVSAFEKQMGISPDWPAQDSISRG